jgi:hypothetical protein
MIEKIVISILFVSLLTACAPAATSVPTEAAPTPYPVQDMPLPQATDQPKTLIAYPSPLDPVPNEGNLTRGKAFVEKADLISLESNPTQIELVVSGSLPTPCNVLKASMKGPDDQNRIQVELYSLVQTDAVCAQVLKPFNTSIPLGSLKSGKYTVSLNGKQVGEFTAP